MMITNVSYSAYSQRPYMHYKSNVERFSTFISQYGIILSNLILILDRTWFFESSHILTHSLSISKVCIRLFLPSISSKVDVLIDSDENPNK